MASLLLASVASVALAHATIVLGTLSLEPNPPQPGSQIRFRLEMIDPTQVPIEDAVVRIDVTPTARGAAVTATFDETAPGIYEATLVLPQGGEYALLMRDQTFRQEEAQAKLLLNLDNAAVDPIPFVFPPTVTASNNLATWLVWLIGLPLVAGVVVTVLVLTGGRRGDGPSDA